MTPAQAEAHFRATAPIYMRRLAGDFPAFDELDLAAIFGNAGHESKGLTDDQEDKPVVKGSRGGANWNQWTGPRRRQFEAFAKERKLDVNGDEAAYLFMVHEMRTTEKAAVPRLLAAKTLKTKTTAWSKGFLRPGKPHYASRHRWAEIALLAYRKAPVVQSPTFPQKGARNNQIVRTIQARLKELGYTEVGNVDGSFGDMTEKAILIFRHDAGLPLIPVIDDALNDALLVAKPRTLADSRTEATPGEVREKVPEARDTWWSKIVSFWSLIVTGFFGFVSFIIENITGAKGLVKPITDVAGKVPLWGWALLLGAGLLTIWLKSKSSEKKSVEAYQEGARR